MTYSSKSYLNKVVGSHYDRRRLAKAIGDAFEEQSTPTKRYDVFLSHSYYDKDTILQVNDFLEENLSLDVFVDWIEKPELDRSDMTPKAAARCGTSWIGVERSYT